MKNPLQIKPELYRWNKIRI